MSSDPFPAQQPDPASRGEPLVPLLRIEQALEDPDALATWYSAVSNALSAELPHDLLGLWLYPAHGDGAVLIGPEALAQDDLTVPLPAPQVEPSQMALLEDIVRDAGYASVACLPIRSGRRDVGLLLAADLRPERFGEDERLMLERVAQHLSPLMGRLSRQWGRTNGATPQVARFAALVDALAFLAEHANSPPLYVAELGRALEPLLPHDHLELLVADAERVRAYRLGEHAGGPLWADPSLAICREHLDLDALFKHRDAVILPDTYQDARWPRGYFTVEEPTGAEVRSVVGVRVRGPHGLAAYLLAGSVSADLYDEQDAALLNRVAGLIASQVWVLVDAFSPAAPPVPAPAAAPEATPALPRPSLFDAVEMLATGTEFAETTRRVADLAARLIPFDEMRFAIRLSEGDRVVLLEPGERRSLPDLPLIPVAGTALAAVLQGELPNSFALVDGEARLVVPLRVASRIHGALVLTAQHPAILREVHLAPAQQLADVIASHLELLRRTALLPPPYLPGWKKVR
jgi:GAF domain-containing protein